MNFFSQPCAAHPDSPKLRAKQGHAKSAKRNRFSASSFLEFRIPRVSASRNRGAHFAFPNQIPPFRPLRPLREISGFTLIELMAATTVLSVILLMMVGMQDQMSRAWSNSNRRTDATREARAAVQMISSDLSGLLTRQNTNMNYPGSIAITNMGLPFVYSSNGVNSSGLALPTGIQSGSSFLFGVCTKKSRSPTDLDLAIFGYYIGQTNTTNINGFTNTSYNLYRYAVPSSNTVAALSGITTSDLKTLFPLIASNSEILARNTCNLRILFYNSKDAGRAVTNGPNYRVFSASSANNYSGSKIHIELSAYPEDSAQKIPFTAWTNSANIQKYARSFEFRIDVARTIGH
jgi:prepilin-type N-terminal cleavage/methylation domain-containing protein